MQYNSIVCPGVIENIYVSTYNLKFLFLNFILNSSGFQLSILIFHFALQTYKEVMKYSTS